MDLPFAQDIEDCFGRKAEAQKKLDSRRCRYREQEKFLFQTIFEAEEIIYFRFNWLYGEISKEMMQDQKKHPEKYPKGLLIMDMVKEVCKRYPAFNEIGVDKLHMYVNPPC